MASMKAFFPNQVHSHILSRKLSQLLQMLSLPAEKVPYPPYIDALSKNSVYKVEMP